MKTVLLDVSKWDLVLDVTGNLAVASDPYSKAQDAASAIKTFQGEVWYNTTLGVPYFQSFLGFRPNISLMKIKFAAAALTVPGVVSAIVFISSLEERKIGGQVQVSDSSGNSSAAGF